MHEARDGLWVGELQDSIGQGWRPVAAKSGYSLSHSLCGALASVTVAFKVDFWHWTVQENQEEAKFKQKAVLIFTRRDNQACGGAFVLARARKEESAFVGSF